MYKLSAAAVSIGAAIVVSFASGCTGTTRALLFNEEYVAFEGTPKAVSALLDGANGFITNGKASADMKSAHWQIREAEIKEETTRNKDGMTWLQKIAASMKAGGEQ